MEKKKSKGLRLHLTRSFFSIEKNKQKWWENYHLKPQDTRINSCSNEDQQQSKIHAPLRRAQNSMGELGQMLFGNHANCSYEQQPAVEW